VRPLWPIRIPAPSACRRRKQWLRRKSMKDRNEEGEAYLRSCPQERDKEEDRLCANLGETEQPNTRAPTRHKNQSQDQSFSNGSHQQHPERDVQATDFRDWLALYATPEAVSTRCMIHRYRRIGFVSSDCLDTRWRRASGENSGLLWDNAWLRLDGRRASRQGRADLRFPGGQGPAIQGAARDCTVVGALAGSPRAASRAQRPGTLDRRLSPRMRPRWMRGLRSLRRGFDRGSCSMRLLPPTSRNAPK
jgi:hypothetical protein